MKNLLFAYTLFASCIWAQEQSNFYATKISIQHDDVYDQTQWETISSLIDHLVKFNKERSNGSAEEYYECLCMMASVLQEIDSILTCAPTIKCKVATFKLEQDVVADKQGIEIILIFKLANTMPENNRTFFEKSMSEFFAACSENPKAAFAQFNSTIPQAFSVMSGESSTSISNYESTK